MISVVVPTYRRPQGLIRLLNALADQQEVGPFEVVVSDDASFDETVATARTIAAPFELLVLDSTVNTGPAGARNRGWRQARGDRIAFVDDDCVPDPGWLSAINEGLNSADIAVGRTRPPAEQLSEVGPFSSLLDIEHNLSFSTCNIAYRREVLEALDGFDETFTFPNGEDADLGLRALKAGFVDRYAPQALVWHDVRPSRFLPHLRRVKYMDGIVALVGRHPEARRNLNAGWFLRSVDKAILICWGAGAVLGLRPRRRSSWTLMLVAIGLYVWQFGKSHYPARSRHEWLRSLPLAFVADNWAVVVMIRGSLRWRTVLL